MPMARNHVLHASLGASVVTAAAVVFGAVAPVALLASAGLPGVGALVLAVGVYLWGSCAPDLDSEGAVASATWAPPTVRSFHDGRLRPNPRGLLRYLVPGSHTLSAVMRLAARWWYAETRGTGDSASSNDAHRKLWHTGPGAVVMAVAVAVLLSPGPGLVVVALLRWWRPEVGVWFDAEPLRGELVGWLVAAGPAALMCGVAGTAWNHRWKAGAAVTGAVAAVVAGPLLGSLWWLWAAAVYCGCWMHVAGDRCSMHGCPRWWAPFARSTDDGQKWNCTGYLPRWARFRTGYGGEALFTLGLIAVWLVVMWCLLGYAVAVPFLDINPM